MSIKQVVLESASSYYTACHSSECTHRQVFLLLQCGCFDLTVSQIATHQIEFTIEFKIEFTIEFTFQRQ